MTTTTARVGPELRSTRVKAGLSREKLAALAGCSVAWVTQLEGGMTPGSSAALDRIWRVLHALADEEGGERS
jgi:transcriptional regulator with XRE-family HTH domain